MSHKSLSSCVVAVTLLPMTYSSTLAIEFSVDEVADIRSGVDSSSPGQLTGFRGDLYFRARGPNGNQLFKTDGTNVTEFHINPAGNAFPFNFTQYRDGRGDGDGLRHQPTW